MRIDGLSDHPKVQQPQTRTAAVRARKEGQSAGDVVEISQGAQEVADLSALATAAPSEPNPRLEEIRERVRSGYYDSAQVRRQVADSVLSSEGMNEVVSDIGQARTARAELSATPDTRPERVEVARQRVDTGYYDSRQVRQDTADRILDELV
jgi:anti-sigma28 factor (negative regulator of flagellin synthesis)